MKYYRALIASVLAALCLIVVTLAPTQAATKSLQWTRLDTDITVLQNGDLQIVETNVIQFTAGTFRFGYRDIDMTRLTDVTNIQATENGKALQTQITQPDSTTTRITYYFSQAQNEQRTFKIAYTVVGATRYYPEGDQVDWVAVYADRNGYPVLNSRVTVRLPGTTTATQAAVYGPTATVTGQGENNVIAVAQEPIDSGQELEIRLQFPHGIITGAPPSWQSAFDQQRTYADTIEPRINLLFLLISLVVLVGGPGLAILLWYRRGRDPNVGLIADYLNEPPPGIAPGIAGTLVDERADLQDVIATLVDLARRGVITMKEEGQEAKSGLLYNRDWVFSRGPSFGAAVTPYERQLLDALDLTHRADRELSDLKYKFYSRIEGIKNALYKQLVTDGHYNRSPEQTRGLYAALGILFIVLAVIAGVVGISIIDTITSTAVCLAGSLGVTAIVLLIIAQAMPARTRKGAEMKMRLEAFKRYLKNIEKYVDVKTATDQFDKYLPFAIAFGIDRTWINKFAAVDAPAPTWYIPYAPYYGGIRGTRGVGGVGPGDISGAARAPISLEGVNKGLTNSLSGLNAGLSSMFSTVASTFVSVPAPKSSSGGWGGGGWSGGGGGGGGGSGGGGGGFG